MKRRTFLKAASGSLLLPQLAFARIPAHNWNSCDFGTGPTAKDRLYQGPFPQYAPEAFIPESEVVMTTTASKEIIPNFGMGLTVYVSGDYWPMRTGEDSVEKYLEDLIKIPFVQKVYIRLNWCNIQSQWGKLDFPEAWEQTFAIAKKYGKRVAFRVMRKWLAPLCEDTTFSAGQCLNAEPGNVEITPNRREPSLVDRVDYKA